MFARLIIASITPDSVAKILDQLGVSERGFDKVGIGGAMKLDADIIEPAAVFPRII